MFLKPMYVKSVFDEEIRALSAFSFLSYRTRQQILQYRTPVDSCIIDLGYYG